MCGCVIKEDDMANKGCEGFFFLFLFLGLFGTVGEAEIGVRASAARIKV